MASQKSQDLLRGAVPKGSVRFRKCMDNLSGSLYNITSGSEELPVPNALGLQPPAQQRNSLRAELPHIPGTTFFQGFSFLLLPQDN